MIEMPKNEALPKKGNNNEVHQCTAGATNHRAAHNCIAHTKKSLGRLNTPAGCSQNSSDQAGPQPWHITTDATNTDQTQIFHCLEDGNATSLSEIKQDMSESA